MRVAPEKPIRVPTPRRPGPSPLKMTFSVTGLVTPLKVRSPVTWPWPSSPAVIAVETKLIVGYFSGWKYPAICLLKPGSPVSTDFGSTVKLSLVACQLAGS